MTCNFNPFSLQMLMDVKLVLMLCLLLSTASNRGLQLGLLLLLLLLLFFFSDDSKTLEKVKYVLQRATCSELSHLHQKIQLHELDQLNQLNQLNRLNRLIQLNRLNQLSQLHQLSQFNYKKKVDRLVCSFVG